MPGDSFYCAPDHVKLEALEDKSIIINSHPYHETLPEKFETNLLSQPAPPPNSFPANYTEDDIPSFNAITDALQDTVPPCMTSYQTSTYSHVGSSSKLVKPETHSYPRLFNSNTPFLYRNSPLMPFKINSPQPEISFGTPLNDPTLLKLMEEFEAKSKRNQIEAGKK